MSLKQSTLEKLHSETAKISWHDLQPYFANGSLLVVDESIDLIEVAVDFAEDSTDSVEEKINAKLVSPPDNQLARQWYLNNIDFWAVVVAPFVLVQVVNNNEPNN